MKNKKKLFFALALCLFLGTCKVSAQTVKSYFPDENLFACLASTASIDENTDESDFDFAALDHLICNTGVSDATGIEKLTGLTILNLDRGTLTSIDVSKNTALKTLSLAQNKLTSIDLSKNTELTDLTLSSNQLTTIDLSKNTALERLNLIYNNFASIDLSKNTALAYLNISKNNLTSIDLSKNTALTSLLLNGNPLASNAELSIGDELDFKKYFNIPDNFVVSSVVEGNLATYSNGRLIITKAGTADLTLTIENKTNGAKEEFEGTLTVIDPKGEEEPQAETKEESETSDTTENPKTGIYGGSIVLVAAAVGAYMYMKNKNKYNSVR